MRAPLFYDRDDTNYYVNPASTATALNIQGAINVKSSHSGGNIALDYFHSSDTYSGNMVMFMSEPGITHDGGGIGNNIATNSPYYGRAINHGYGVYLRFYKTNGHFEFWNTQGTAGTAGGQGTRRFYGDASGNTYSQSSSRAPIFYDSDNTGYYLNPASTSSLNGLTVNGTITGNISGNANTLDNIDSGSFLRSDATDYQNNTIYQRGYLVNETSYRNRGVYGNYNSTKTNHIWSMGVAYKNHASGTNFGNLYGLAYKHTNNTTGGNMAGGHQMVWCSNGTGRSAMGDNIWTSGNVKAPLYYDSNNTAYYTNPAGTSVVQRITHINHTTPILIKVNSGYKSWVHHVSSSSSYIFAPSTANGGESWDWANQMSISTSGVVTANNFVLSSDKRSKTKIKDLTCDNIDVSWKSFEMKGNEE